MEIRTVSDALIYLGTLAGALAAIGLVIRFAIIGPFRNFVKRLIHTPLVDIRTEVTNMGQRLEEHLTSHHGPVTRGYRRG